MTNNDKKAKLLVFPLSLYDNDPEVDILTNKRKMLYLVNSSKTSTFTRQLKRGDLVKFDLGIDCGNGGKFIYNGKKIVKLGKKLGLYATLPHEYNVITEFPILYWSNILENNHNIWFRDNRYFPEIRRNLREVKICPNLHVYESKFTYRDKTTYTVVFYADAELLEKVTKVVEEIPEINGHSIEDANQQLAAPKESLREISDFSADEFVGIKDANQQLAENREKVVHSVEEIKDSNEKSADIKEVIIEPIDNSSVNKQKIVKHIEYIPVDSQTNLKVALQPVEIPEYVNKKPKAKKQYNVVDIINMTLRLGLFATIHESVHSEFEKYDAQKTLFSSVYVAEYYFSRKHK